VILPRSVLPGGLSCQLDFVFELGGSAGSESAGTALSVPGREPRTRSGRRGQGAPAGRSRKLWRGPQAQPRTRELERSLTRVAGCEACGGAAGLVKPGRWGSGPNQAHSPVDAHTRGVRRSRRTATWPAVSPQEHRGSAQRASGCPVDRQ
jgi:hypothetical protein